MLSLFILSVKYNYKGKNTFNTYTCEAFQPFAGDHGVM